MIKFNKNIIVSRTYKELTLIYDGIENYYLYYQDKNIDVFSNCKNTPRDIHKENFKDNYTSSTIFSNEDEIKTKFDLTQWLINNINDILKELKPSAKLNTFQELIRTLKDAFIDEKVLSKLIENSSKVIRDKLLELNNLYDDIEEDYIYLNEIEAETEIINKNANKEFLKLLDIYDHDPIRLFDNKLTLYLSNSENLFKMVIHGLGANLKKVSRIIILNGGSKSGKSRLKTEVKNMMPIFRDIGRSTPAYITGKEDPYYYDGQIIYGGDKGLTIDDQNNFEKIVGFFGELATDRYTFKGYKPNNQETEVEFYVDGLIFFITEPYTNLSTFKASDQMKSRTTYITVKELTNEQVETLEKNEYEIEQTGINTDKEFEQLHKQYISSIINNPLDINIGLDLRLEIVRRCKHDKRVINYHRNLFYAYCQYLNIVEPTKEDLNKFLDIFLDKHEITDIEFMVYELLYNNLQTLTEKEFDKRFNNGWNEQTDMLKSRSNRKSKTFFTAKQVKTYFKSEFRGNKHLKDIIDSIAEILSNLYDVGLLERLETPSKQENIYYIPYNKELEDD